MTASRHIACDLGAESGRVMLGTLDGGRLTLEEIHRFPTGGIRIAGSLRWDLLRIVDELKAGMRAVAARGQAIDSLSCDSWANDYVLIGAGEPMLTAPFHYRDRRTDGGFELVAQRMSLDELYAETGIQPTLVSTLFQLQADTRIRPQVLQLAETLVTVADHVHWLFSGVARIEASMASITQLYDPRAKAWSWSIIERLGLPGRLLPPIVPSGTTLGRLLPEIAAETGLNRLEVIATCSHDTGAAVAAVPARSVGEGAGEGWAYLSSGTWSPLGIEVSAPIITPASRRGGFTNEGGWGGSIRFLKNLVGLWLVQECRRAWAGDGREHSYEQLAELARAAEPLASHIDPAEARFAKPGRMPEKIADYCRETGQSVPRGPGEVVRCALESLALSYRRTLDGISAITGEPLKSLHIVGGGSRNRLLNQLAADATGREVIAGPGEATAIGNVLMQAIVRGRIADHAELRRVVRESFPVETYRPHGSAGWDSAYRRFQRMSDTCRTPIPPTEVFSP